MRTWAVLVAGVAVAAAPSHRLAAADMTASWTVDGAWLEVEVTAPTTGWVLVGFHDREALAGARLMMAAVGPDGPVGEEHLADPPRHARRQEGAVATLISASQTAGTTTARFRVPLDPQQPGLPTLQAGARTWMWLAWSLDDDFQHHSARREGAWVVL